MSDQNENNAQVISLLERLLDRVERLEARLDQLTGLAGEAQNIAAIAVDTMDETVVNLAKDGVDLQQRAREGAALLKTLTEERTLRTIEKLVQHIGNLEPAVEALGELPGMVAMFGDIFDESIKDLARQGIHVEAVAQNLAHGIRRSAELVETDSFSVLMDSAILEPSTLRVVSKLGEAMAEAQNSERSVGMFGMLGALGDPDVKRATGFLLDMAKHLGKNLSKEVPLRKLKPAFAKS